MQTTTLHRGLAVIAIAVIAIAGISLAAGRGRTDTAVGGDGPGVGYGDDVDNAVLTQVNQALGRQPVPPTSPPTSQEARSTSKVDAGNVAAPAPAPSPSTAGGVGGGITGTAPNANGLTTASDRKIVQTASLKLQVKEVGGGFEEIGRIATAAGGFVASSSFSYVEDVQVASVTVRVPAARYQEVLGQLRAIGSRVDSESSNASDVTEEYTDLSARLRNLEATEQQLLGFLAQAKNVAEVLQVQDRLNSTRNEIERVKGRLNLVERLTDLATITAHLRPAIAGADGDSPSTGLDTEVREAWDDSLEFLGGIAAVVVTAVVFVWWLPLVAAPAYFGYLRLRNRDSAAAALD